MKGLRMDSNNGQDEDEESRALEVLERANLQTSSRGEVFGEDSAIRAR